MYTGALLFLNQSRNRLARHVFFWLLFAIYFTIQSYYPSGISGIVDLHYIKSALLSTCFFLPYCILSTYVFLYYLTPRFLQKNRLLSFMVGFLALFVAGLCLNYFMSALFFKYSTSAPAKAPQPFFLGLHNAVIATVLSIFVVGIKLGKSGYLQQKANLELVRQKTKAELQLLKTRVDPQFLFRSLENLQKKIKKEEPDSPAAILELSDILSYILYDCEEESVPLAKEIAAVNAFLTLERTGSGKQTLVTFRITGNCENKNIIPLTLLSLLQHCFHYVHTTIQELREIHTGIRVGEKNRLQFSVRMERRLPCPSIPEIHEFDQKMKIIRDRLDVLYPDAYHLEWEKDKNVLDLNLELTVKETGNILNHDNT